MASKPTWIPQKLIIPLIQAGLEKEPALPDVPLILDQPVKPEDKPLLEFMARASTVGRPLATTPGVPAERVAALRTAFAATIADPEFIAAAASEHFEFSPMSADQAVRPSSTGCSTRHETCANGSRPRCSRKTNIRSKDFRASRNCCLKSSIQRRVERIEEEIDRIMATAIIDGITTRYEVIGSGPPLLMYAPAGFDATSTSGRRKASTPRSSCSITCRKNTPASCLRPARMRPVGRPGRAPDLGALRRAGQGIARSSQVQRAPTSWAAAWAAARSRRSAWPIRRRC